MRGETGTGNSQDRLGCPPVNLKIRHEFVQRYAIRQPVEELLYGQPAAAKTGRPAHPARIDPYRLVDRHRVLLQRTYPGPSENDYHCVKQAQANGGIVPDHGTLRNQIELGSLKQL